jgi:hypothetical protein
MEGEESDATVKRAVRLLGVLAAAACGDDPVPANQPPSAPMTPAQPAVTQSRTPLADQVLAQWKLQRGKVPVREISVRLAADEEFRAAAPDWEADARRRVACASDVLEREFRVRLRVVDCVPWKSDDHAVDLHLLHRTVDAKLLCEEADLVLVFARQDKPSGSRTDYDRGVAYYYGRSCIVRTGEGPRAWPYEDETVVHEVCHVLGAWHVPIDSSVMRAPKSGKQIASFDPTSAAAVVLGRDVDLRRGLDGIDLEKARKVTDLWKELHAPGTDAPLLDAYNARAYTHEVAGRLEAAAHDYERGVELAAQLRVAQVPDRLRIGHWRLWPKPAR